MDGLHIGLDVGTSSVKFLVVDENLEILHESSVPYEYERPNPDWDEMDPHVWTAIVLDGLADICSRFKRAHIRGIGVTGQMHTTVFIGTNGQPVYPAILWTDRRTNAVIPQLASRLAADSSTERSAGIVSSGCMLSSLYWLKHNRPDAFASLGYVMTPMDFIVWSLTGAVSTDHSSASTSSIYDWDHRDWSDVAQREFGLPRRIFPPIHSASSQVGFLSPQVLQRVGWTSSIPVVAGTGDNVASALACGGLTTGGPVLSIGTSGVVIVPNISGELKDVGKNVGCSLVPGDRSVICQGSVGAGGRSLNWWLEEMLGTRDYAGAERQIHTEALGANRVLFFPHMKGEKTVYREPGLRGAFYGLGLDTTRADTVQAVQEGVGFALRALYERIRNIGDPPYFTVVGGASRNRLWIRILANIFNCPMKVYKKSHEAVRGAAMLSLIGSGSPLPADDGDYVMVHPDPGRPERYDRAYHDYVRLGDCLLMFARGESRS